MKMTVKEKQLVSSQDAQLRPSPIHPYPAAALDAQCSKEGRMSVSGCLLSGSFPSQCGGQMCMWQEKVANKKFK